MRRYLFTCEVCGGHELYVEHYFTRWYGHTWTICRTAADLNLESTGDHCPADWDDPEEVEAGEEEDVWQLHEDGEDGWVDEESVEFYVLCSGCHREIEFGWSHPDRGGRVWPAECSDFNPWLSWPEPRHRDSWARKGWLPPGHRR